MDADEMVIGHDISADVEEHLQGETMQLALTPGVALFGISIQIKQPARTCIPVYSGVRCIVGTAYAIGTGRQRKGVLCVHEI